jgi:two-component system, sensor histidine kinase and response regulator
MKKYVAFLLIFFNCCCYIQAHSQRTTWTYIPNDRHGADSLLKILAKETDPKKQVLLYKGLAWNYKDTNMDTAIFYADKGLELAKETDFTLAEIDITRMKSIIYWGFLHHNVAYDLNYTALEMAKKNEYIEGEAFGYDRIGIMEFYRGNYADAIAHFKKSLDLFVKIKNKDGLAYSYNHLNWAYAEQKKYKKALHYGKISLQIREEQNNPRGVSKSLSDIALVFKKMGELDSAIHYLKAAIQTAVNIKEYLYQAEFCQQLSAVYLLQNKLDSALYYANTSYNLANQIINSRQVVKSAEVLSKIYKQKGDFKNAFKYHDIFYTTKDSLITEEAERNTIQQEIKYEYEKEQAIIMQRQKLIRISLISVIILLGTIAFLVYRDTRRTKRNNQLLQQKNKKILLQKEEIEKQAKYLEELNNIKSKLFTIVSHDLKNPIALTSVYMHLLHEEAMTEEEFQMLLPEISKHLKNTSALMNNLLLWANSQMDGLSWNPVPFDLFELAESNAEIIRSFAKIKGIIINNEVEPKSFVFADKAMLDIVFRNLLTNAVKFCKQGDTITLSAIKTCNGVQVNICDTGVGMDAHTIKNMFVEQMHSEIGTANEKGWGLGLILCREFVERNKGKIWVESEIGKGSEFHFTIPSNDNPL